MQSSVYKKIATLLLVLVFGSLVSATVPRPTYAADEEDEEAVRIAQGNTGNDPQSPQQPKEPSAPPPTETGDSPPGGNTGNDPQSPQQPKEPGAPPQPEDSGTPPPATTDQGEDPESDVSTCGLFRLFLDPIECGQRLVFKVVYTPFAVLLSLAGLVLNLSIDLTIHKFPLFVEQITGISIAWKVFRDVLNITFIFILLYAGIKMILGMGADKKVITKVILAGLLINFSFFFTKAIIDVSNVFTVEFNNAIQELGEGAETQLGPEKYLTTGISAIFMNAFSAKSQSYTALASGLVRMIAAIITFVIATFVFLAAALMLVVRFLMLIILLITSPIAVFSGLLPQLSELSQKWWKELIGQAIFAPILMLFLLIVALVVANPGFKAAFEPKQFVGAVGGSSEELGLLLMMAVSLIQYAIVIGLMIASIVIAKQMSGSASKGMMGWATKTAGKGAFAGMSFAGSHTIGRLGAKFADSDTVNRLRGSKSSLAQFAGSSLYKVGTGVGKSSFDARGVLPGSVGAGKAAPGFIARKEAQEKERKASEKQLKENLEERAKRDARGIEDRERERAEAEFQNLERQRYEAHMGSRDTSLSPGEQNRWRTEEARLRNEIETRREGQPRSEVELRNNLAVAAAGVNPGEIGHINAVINDKEIKEITDPLKKQTKILESLNENERRYYQATQDMTSFQKSRSDREKLLKEQLASRAIGSSYEGEQKMATDLLKELRKSKKDQFWDAVKKVGKEEGVAFDEAGEAPPPKEEKPPEPEKGGEAQNT